MFFRYAVVHRMVIDMKNAEKMISYWEIDFCFAIVFNNIQIVIENINDN